MHDGMPEATPGTSNDQYRSPRRTALFEVTMRFNQVIEWVDPFRSDLDQARRDCVEKIRCGSLQFSAVLT